jgi:hypothetical protein
MKIQRTFKSYHAAALWLLQHDVQSAVKDQKKDGSWLITVEGDDAKRIAEAETNTEVVAP